MIFLVRVSPGSLTGVVSITANCLRVITFLFNPCKRIVLSYLKEVRFNFWKQRCAHITTVLLEDGIPDIVIARVNHRSTKRQPGC